MSDQDITLIVLLFMFLWWTCGIIATVLLYKQGKIHISEWGFMLVLSAFPGPLAFFELRS